MPHANQPAGPGRPIQERRDAATEREELDEAQGRADDDAQDPTRAARQAERNAHVSPQDKNTASGTSGNRRG
jgi:hypothetical protein